MYDNKFWLGASANGYTFIVPPQAGREYSVDEMVELAALIVVMKSEARTKFDAAMKRMEGPYADKVS